MQEVDWEIQELQDVRRMICLSFWLPGVAVMFAS